MEGVHFAARTYWFLNQVSYVLVVINSRTQKDQKEY